MQMCDHEFMKHDLNCTYVYTVVVINVHTLAEFMKYFGKYDEHAE